MDFVFHELIQLSRVRHRLGFVRVRIGGGYGQQQGRVAVLRQKHGHSRLDRRKGAAMLGLRGGIKKFVH